MVTSRKRPQWLISLQAHIQKAAYIHREMGNARREYEPQYRRNRNLGRRAQELPPPGPINWHDVCQVVCLTCTTSTLNPVEYEALNAEWHEPMKEDLPVVSYLLEILSECDHCMSRVEEADIPHICADEEEAEAIEEFRHFINKFKGAERRRVLRMAHSMNENGTETVYRTSDNGHPSADQHGLSASFQPRRQQTGA